MCSIMLKLYYFFVFVLYVCCVPVNARETLDFLEEGVCLFVYLLISVGRQSRFKTVVLGQIKP